MLDNETKRRIDTARDILVGKVPDPKSQVEQITIALVYKFMDDMDMEAVELGGKPSFFTGDYERYAWHRIFDPRIGGYEMLNLYADAITRMSQNPNLPELFRNIFKNAYLPYRDPETLKLFLKTINEFTYDHSERLGDAFEYLLSVLGSQGDAGQFRTPRHIIDFMVAIVSPQKNELILDPACGTAGFLISAYKHIMRENTSEKYRSSNGNGRGDLLTTEERKKLLTNFKGYDISPDMVRLSLVNMYLHGFVNPQIYEYDTLTSEDRWNEYADVILANPPFMTPKGGIKPHKRFSVQSNRSEVLFVDYIVEHLTPTGRAAVIVPEGIIFQSANAYKQLRRMLVENYLYAVVSLPAGVFQPYSGVKTSILLMDKVLSKKTDSILFVKIENDGFDLGAQRRPIDRNDLPDALQVIREYIDKVRNGKADEFNADEKPCSALLVKKEKLAENGEYNLTSDRYRVVEKRKHQKWPMVRLGEIAEYINGFPFKPTDWKSSGKKIIRIQNLTGTSDTYNYTDKKDIPNKYLIKRGDLLISWSATIGFYFWNDEEAYLNQHIFKVVPSEKVLKEYLYVLRFKIIEEITGNVHGNTMKHITKDRFDNIIIPLPPLEVQQEIVAEIEGYQKIIDGCRQVIDAWKPDVEWYLDEALQEYNQKIEQDKQDRQDKKDKDSVNRDYPIHPEHPVQTLSAWPMVKLGEVCEKITKGSSPNWQGINYTDHPGILFITSENIGFGELLLNNKKYVEHKFNEIEKKSILKKGDVLTNIVGASIGRTCLFYLEEISNINQAVCLIRCKKNFLNNYYLMYLLNSTFYLKILHSNKVENVRANLSLSFFENLGIPLPPLEVQNRIVDKIESERKVINNLREMVKTYEGKIKRVIDRVWGE
ncbi:MAG: N-6 DNA methylase [Spirochaetota bacterium]|nr:N-6 DNA methylase [Spirochaetota bacterium]